MAPVLARPRRANVALALMLLGLVTGSCKSDEEQTIELVEEMATLFEKHQSNCDLLGTKFEAFTGDNTARFLALKRLGRLEGAPKRAFEKKYGARLETAMRKLMDGATACMSNPKVADALKKIR